MGFGAQLKHVKQTGDSNPPVNLMQLAFPFYSHAHFYHTARGLSKAAGAGRAPAGAFDKRRIIRRPPGPLHAFRVIFSGASPHVHKTYAAARFVITHAKSIGKSPAGEKAKLYNLTYRLGVRPKAVNNASARADDSSRNNLAWPGRRTNFILLLAVPLITPSSASDGNFHTRIMFCHGCVRDPNAFPVGNQVPVGDNAIEGILNFTSYPAPFLYFTLGIASPISD